MSTMERADKKKNRLLPVKHTHTYTTKDHPFSKTYPLMLAMERADKKRNMLLLVEHIYTYTTLDHSVKLTS